VFAGDQVVCLSGQSTQTCTENTEHGPLLKQSPSVRTSALVTASVLQWTGSMVHQLEISVGFMAAGPVGQGRDIMEWIIISFPELTVVSGLPVVSYVLHVFFIC